VPVFVTWSPGTLVTFVTDYTVDLPVFRGPMDLLLYLVKRNEVDIVDIPSR